MTVSLERIPRKNLGPMAFNRKRIKGKTWEIHIQKQQKFEKSGKGFGFGSFTQSPVGTCYVSGIS